MIVSFRADAARIPLADGSVHCVVTSPPYMGLRAYRGVPPTVWGGDPAHARVWGAMERGKKGDRAPHEGDAGNDALGAREFAQGGAPMNGGRFCACGAWRGCLGNEPTVDLYVAHMVECFREVRRVLRDDGTAWCILGDSFGQGGRLLGVPWRVALALQANGWLLRNDLAWCKTSAMPESVSGWRWQRCRVKVASKDLRAVRPQKSDVAHAAPQKGLAGHSGGAGVYIPSATWADCPGCDRCRATDGYVLRRGSWRHTRAHEQVFMLAKSMAYYADAEAVAEPARETSLARYEYGLHLRRDEGAITGSAHDRVHAGLANGRPMGDGLTHPATRNPRSYMLLGPEPLAMAHFAAYPTALVEPLIRVSCPARCCAACGAPWARVVERGETAERRRETAERTGRTDGRTENDGTPRAPSRTLGFRSTCAHADAPAVPGIVLDCFAGSGTTGRVALELGRRAVLCDLSQTYLADIAARRTSGVQLPLSPEMA